MSNNEAPGDGWEIDADLDKSEGRKDADPGRYLCRVASMEKKQSKDKEKDFFNLAFEIIDCEDADHESSIGARVFDIFNINQEALWKLKALISACGFDAHGSRIPNLVDCEVMLDAFEDDYQGRKSLKTKRYKNPTEKGWAGLHETRDATTPPPTKGKANEPATGESKPAPLANKKIAKPGSSSGKDEVEV